MTDQGLGPLTCEDVREMAGTFVLGALEPSDDAAVRKHLAACPDPHGEIPELGGVIGALALGVPSIEPPARLKTRIMAAAAADLAARRTDRADRADVAPMDVAPTPTIQLTPFPTASERAARRSRASAGAWLLRIAAVLAIVGLAGWNVLLQGQLGAATTYQQDLAAVLGEAGRPGSLIAVLKADAGTGAGMAAITASGRVTIAMQDLQPTTGEAVYEAWAIGGDGVAVPLGSFTVAPSRLASFEASGVPATNGLVIALTREPAAGATKPTLPIISKGVATLPG